MQVKEGESTEIEFVIRRKSNFRRVIQNRMDHGLAFGQHGSERCRT